MPLGKTSLQILCSTRPNPLSLYNVYISDKTPFHCTTCVCIYIYMYVYVYIYIYINEIKGINTTYIMQYFIPLIS